MTRSPRERLHTHVDILCSCSGCLKNRRHLESRGGMAVMLYRYVRVTILDTFDDFPNGYRPANTRHILDADLFGSHLYQCIREVGKRLYRVHGCYRKAKGGL